MRGKRALSNFTHAGVYCGLVFFQVPNHSSTTRSLRCARLREQRVDEAEVEAALDGSTCSHETGTSTVLAPMSFTAAQTLSSAAGPVARVVDLRAQHRERRAVDDQRMAPVALDQLRLQRRLRGLHEPAEQGERQGSGTRDEGSDHGYRCRVGSKVVAASRPAESGRRPSRHRRNRHDARLKPDED